MKNIYYLIISAMFLASCDLELQKPYEFVPETPKFVDFKNQNALEFIQTRQTPAGTVANGENLDSLLKAITIAGLESEFTNTDTNRTFLFLNNTAWVGTTAGKILRDIGNVTSIRAMNIDKLRNLLRYHVVQKYVHQIRDTPDYNLFYYHQSLIVGDPGLVSFKRDERYYLTINSGPRIPSNTRKGASIHRHNYQLKNGIAHYLNTYVRYVAF
jgi:hypothetical protein